MKIKNNNYIPVQNWIKRKKALERRLSDIQNWLLQAETNDENWDIMVTQRTNCENKISELERKIENPNPKRKLALEFPKASLNNKVFTSIHN